MADLATIQALYEEERDRQLKEDQAYRTVADRNRWAWVGEPDRVAWRQNMEAALTAEGHAPRLVRPQGPAKRVRVVVVVQVTLSAGLGFVAGYLTALGL